MDSLAKKGIFITLLIYNKNLALEYIPDTYRHFSLVDFKNWRGLLGKWYFSTSCYLFISYYLSLFFLCYSDVPLYLRNVSIVGNTRTFWSSFLPAEKSTASSVLVDKPMWTYETMRNYYCIKNVNKLVTHYTDREIMSWL